MKNLNYTINTKYNDNFITTFVNFENKTYAKVVVFEKQGLKMKFYKLYSITGNYDITKINVSMGTLGEVIITPISSEVANVNEILSHKIFGKVEILSSENGTLKIKVLKTKETKSVIEKYFMNGIV